MQTVMHNVNILNIVTYKFTKPNLEQLLTTHTHAHTYARKGTCTCMWVHFYIQVNQHNNHSGYFCTLLGHSWYVLKRQGSE